MSTTEDDGPLFRIECNGQHDNLGSDHNWIADRIGLVEFCCS